MMRSYRYLWLYVMLRNEYSIFFCIRKLRYPFCCGEINYISHVLVVGNYLNERVKLAAKRADI